MKILLLADVNSPHTQRWLHAIASDSRLRVAIFSFTAQTVSVPSDVIVFDSGLDASLARRANLYGKAWRYIKTLPRLRQAVKQFQPDVIHAMYASSYGLLGALLNFKEYYVSCWGSDIFSFPQQNFVTRSVLQFVLSQAKRVYSTSHFMANEIRKYTKAEAVVIPYGVDTTIFLPGKNLLNDFDPNNTVIGTVKSHEATYGIDVLIRGFALLYKRLGGKIKLLLVGEGSQTTALKQLTRDLGMTDHVVFTGKVTHDETVSMHRAIDIFVAPTLHESFGVSLLEAMSCGKPCVVSDIPPYREIDGDANAMMYFKSNDAESLCDNLAMLINDSEERNRLGTAARHRVLEKYDAALLEEKIIKEYLN